jgi:hypothetical protein
VRTVSTVVVRGTQRTITREGTIVAIVPRVGTVQRSINDYGQCHLEVEFEDDGTREIGDHGLYKLIN